MMRSLRAVCFVGSLLACSLLVAGCGGPKTAKVSGTVMFGGKALPGGKITFYPANGGAANPASADIQEDGTYTVTNVPVGEVKVTVSTDHLSGKLTTRNAPPGGVDAQMKPPAGAGANIPQKPDNAGVKLIGTYTKIPAKYGKPETTDLTYTISGDKSGHEVTLQ